MERDGRVERSMPVQSRVDLISLARLDKYWMAEGYYIRTMSQLVNWSIDLLCEVLISNNKMPDGIGNGIDANKHLLQRGLYQPSMLKKGFKKRATALGFESLRNERVDPAGYAKEQYRNIHNEGSVKVFEGEVRSGKEEMHYGDEIEEALKRAEEEDRKERDENTKKAIEAARDSGRLAEEPERVGLREGMNKEEVDVDEMNVVKEEREVT